MDAAAFDFDGTLTNRGSVFGFLTAVAGAPAVLRSCLELSPKLGLAALTGGGRADRTKEELFVRVLAGTPAGRLGEIGSRYGRDHVERTVRSDVRARFDWHRDRGDRVVVVSASPEVYVGEAARRLGADGVIATKLEVGADGRVTGRYDGANCRGSEKLRRLRIWLDECGPAPERVWCYGNSRGDLTMLAAADLGVNVGHFGRIGALRAYSRLGKTPPEEPEPRPSR